MCLLIHCPLGKTVPEAHIRESWSRNRDGGGFAYHEPKNGLHLTKGFMDVEEFVTALKEHAGKQMVVHLRFATHGAHDELNTHPFEAGGGWVMGHNGVLSDARIRGKESDTAAFVRDCIYPVLSDHPKEILHNGKWRKTLEIATKGSKLVFLHSSGKHVIIHENEGHYNEGVWYSNSSYRVYTPTPRKQWTPSNSSYNYTRRQDQPWYKVWDAYAYGTHDMSKGGIWVRNTETVEDYMAKHGWKRKAGRDWGEWEKITVPADVPQTLGLEWSEGQEAEDPFDPTEGLHQCHCMKATDICDLCDKPFGAQRQYFDELDKSFICHSCFVIMTQQPEEEPEQGYRFLKEGDLIPPKAEWQGEREEWNQSWCIGGRVGKDELFRLYRVPVDEIIEMTPVEGPGGTVYEAAKAHAEDDGPVCVNGEDDSEPETPESNVLLFPASPEV